MSGLDLVNGAFESLGGIFLFLNVLRVLKDKSVKGISIVPTAFFSVWGVWNLFYYPSLDQWASFFGGALVVVMNTIWVSLAIYYARRKPTTDAVKILHDRYVGDDPARLAALEEARREADEEQAEFDKTGVDPHE